MRASEPHVIRAVQSRTLTWLEGIGCFILFVSRLFPFAQMPGAAFAAMLTLVFALFVLGGAWKAARSDFDARGRLPATYPLLIAFLSCARLMDAVREGEPFLWARTLAHAGLLFNLYVESRPRSNEALCVGMLAWLLIGFRFSPPAEGMAATPWLHLALLVLLARFEPALPPASPREDARTLRAAAALVLFACALGLVTSASKAAAFQNGLNILNMLAFSAFLLRLMQIDAYKRWFFQILSILAFFGAALAVYRLFCLTLHFSWTTIRMNGANIDGIPFGSIIASLGPIIILLTGHYRARRAQWGKGTTFLMVLFCGTFIYAANSQTAWFALGPTALFFLAKPAFAIFANCWKQASAPEKMPEPHAPAHSRGGFRVRTEMPAPNRDKKLERKNLAKRLAAIALLAALVFFGKRAIQQEFSRADAKGFGESMALSGRVAAERFPFGLGFGEPYVRFQGGDPDGAIPIERQASMLQRPAGSLAAAVLEGAGLLGLAALALFFYAPFKTLRRAAREGEKTKTKARWALAAWLAALLFLLLSNPFGRPYPEVLFWLLMIGLIAESRQLSDKSGREAPAPPPALELQKTRRRRALVGTTLFYFFAVLPAYHGWTLREDPREKKFLKAAERADWPEARKINLAMARFNSQNPRLLMREGWLARADQDAFGMEEAFRKAALADPLSLSRPDIYQANALASIQSKDDEKTIALLQKQAIVRPDWFDSTFWTAAGPKNEKNFYPNREILRYLGNPKSSADDWPEGKIALKSWATGEKRQLAGKPAKNAPSLKECLAPLAHNCLSKPGPLATREASDCNRLAAFYATAQIYEEAQQVVQRLIDDDPQLAENYYTLIALLSRSGQSETAKKELDRIDLLSAPDVFRLRAEKARLKGNWIEAEALLRKDWEKRSDMSATRELFEANRRIGKPRRAEGWMREWRLFHPGDGAASLALGRFLANQGEFEAAQSAFYDAINWRTPAERVWAHLIELEILYGNVKKARLLEQFASKHAGRNAALEKATALLEGRGGDETSEARPTAAASEKSNMSEYEAALFKCREQLEAGTPEKGLRPCRRAAILYPGSGRALEMTALAYRAAGKPDEADLLQQAAWIVQPARRSPAPKKGIDSDSEEQQWAALRRPDAADIWPDD